jgi:glutamyl-tRNA synthetase
VQIAEQAAFLFVSDEDLVYDEKSLEKLLTTERANDVLDAVIEFVEKCEWGDRIELQAPIAALGLKPGKMMGLVYTAIQGASSGIPVFESIGLLGRERTLHRLRAARARLAGA